MNVRKIYVHGRTFSIGDINKDNVDNFKLAIKIGAICNNAKFVANENILGDATEVSLIKIYTKFFGDYEKLKESYKIMEEIPFSSERKCMSVLCDDGNMYIKGAPEVILEKSSKVLINGREEKMTMHIKSKILTENKKMAKDALRVIAVGVKKCDFNINEGNITFVSLIGMMDPPREGVAEARVRNWIMYRAQNLEK